MRGLLIDQTPSGRWKRSRLTRLVHDMDSPVGTAVGYVPDWSSMRGDSLWCRGHETNDIYGEGGASVEVWPTRRL